MSPRGSHSHIIVQEVVWTAHEKSERTSLLADVEKRCLVWMAPVCLRGITFRIT